MSKLSFTTMGTPDQDARGAIEFATRFGYKGIDLRVSDFKGEIAPDANMNDLQEVRTILDSEGVELAGLLCYNKIGSDEPTSWQEMTDSLVQHLNLGIALGAPTIRMFGGNPYGELATSEFIKRTAECINKALSEVSSAISIVLQNHMGSYTAADGMVLSDTVANERFGLAFSPDHCFLMKEDIAGVFARIRPYARQFYISDIIETPSPDGNHCHSGILPGKGLVPLKEAYSAIGGNAFEGYVTFKWEKIWQPHLEAPEEALPFFVDWWKQSF